MGTVLKILKVWREHIWVKNFGRIDIKIDEPFRQRFYYIPATSSLCTLDNHY